MYVRVNTLAVTELAVHRSKMRASVSGRHESLTGAEQRYRARCLCSAMLDKTTPENAPHTDTHCMWSSQACDVWLPAPRRRSAYTCSDDGLKALPHITISSTISLTMSALTLSLQR